MNGGFMFSVQVQKGLAQNCSCIEPGQLNKLFNPKSGRFEISNLWEHTQQKKPGIYLLTDPRLLWRNIKATIIQLPLALTCLFWLVVLTILKNMSS